MLYIFTLPTAVSEVQLLAKSLNTLSYFTQLPYHPSFSVLLKILKSHKISMHIVSFQNNSKIFNSNFKYIEQGFFRIERITFSRYYVVKLEKCEIVFKFLASNCILFYSPVLSSTRVYNHKLIQQNRARKEVHR